MILFGSWQVLRSRSPFVLLEKASRNAATNGTSWQKRNNTCCSFPTIKSGNVKQLSTRPLDMKGNKLQQRAIATSTTTSVGKSQSQEIESGNAVSSEILKDMEDLFLEIKKELGGRDPELCSVAHYYFDSQGKAIRPLTTMIMARTVNAHLADSGQQSHNYLLPEQKKLTLALEMIHTATLVHDDVIDRSNKRRGKASANVVFGEKRTILSGDYILATAGSMVARLGNDELIEMFAQIMEDLVHGEFMQLEVKVGKSDRFSEYIGKTFNKTASLVANGCKGVAILAGGDEVLVDNAFQYGKHLGIAFQVVDDLLDFISSTTEVGKPVVADLQLGLATAPVLYAAEEFPELDSLIERKFSETGDVARALEFVEKSKGLEKTKKLAEQHCMEAVKYANLFRPSGYRSDLVRLTEKVLNRTK